MKNLIVEFTEGGSFPFQVDEKDTLTQVRSKIAELRGFLEIANPAHFWLCSKSQHSASQRTDPSLANDRHFSIEQERETLAYSLIEGGEMPIFVVPSTTDPTLQDDLKRKSSPPLSEERQYGDESSHKKARVETDTDQTAPLSPSDSNGNTNVKIEQEVVDLTKDSTEDAQNRREQDDRLPTGAGLVTSSAEDGLSDQPYSPPSLEPYYPKMLDIDSTVKVGDDNGRVKIDKTLEQCTLLLNKAKDIINQSNVHLFCPKSQREEWNQEIEELFQSEEPEITIGCLGGTGVGKSSLLKALLNEDNILPTSSSRGCTAAVVELKFNRDFYDARPQPIDVYLGTVEFLSLQDWLDELKLLIGDCCDDESQKVTQSKGEESEEAMTSWSKIDAVYGQGTMKSHEDKTKDSVFKILSEDETIVSLLRCDNKESSETFNTVDITEGKVFPDQTSALLSILSDPSSASHDKKLVRQQRKWADAFRKSINSYVYRRGNGKGPQTWPLIRKVVLRGPWQILATGACLVDLPGVRDANAARAKVSEKYIQNCTKIWIFAPIKRAVDDKTAKDLLGDEFKRRLLMDGNYGNVSFVCTHSDDCEISEIMHDHEDTARDKEGRWEQMLSLKEKTSLLAKCGEELEDEIDDVLSDLSRLDSLGGDGGDDRAKERSRLLLRQDLLKSIQHQKTDDIDKSRRKTHQQLKILASQVRNEFSKRSLQTDFRNGIEELFSQADPSNKNLLGGSEGNVSTVLPADFELEVFCTASNEYLKLKGIKALSDGKATCFTSPDETGIPEIVQSVAKITEKLREEFAISFVKRAGNILGRIYLYASESKVDSKTVSLLAGAFNKQMGAVSANASKIAEDFNQQMRAIIQQDLEPHLKMAATRADKESICIVDDWFACAPRTRSDPRNKGIHWGTFGAAVRRGGVYKSAIVGPISLNQEICDPLEKEFCCSWNQVMVTSLSKLLLQSKEKFLKLSRDYLDAVVSSFLGMGLDAASTQWMKSHGMQGVDLAIDVVFSKLTRVASKRARKLNRSSVPKIRAKLQSTYSAAATVAGGSGKASRQANAMKNGSQKVLKLSVFDPIMSDLFKESVALTSHLTEIMLITPRKIRKSLHQVCCQNWNDKTHMEAMNDLRVLVEVFDCRNAMLPNLVRLCLAHDNAMKYMGMDVEEMTRVTVNEPPAYVEAKKKLLEAHDV